MATEEKKIKLRRGTQSAFNTVTLEEGEPGFVTDSKKVFVGSSSGNVQVTTTVNDISSDITIEGSGGITVSENGQTITVNGPSGTVTQINSLTPNLGGIISMGLSDITGVSNPQDYQILRYLDGEWINAQFVEDFNYYVDDVLAPDGANGDVTLEFNEALNDIVVDMRHSHGELTTAGALTNADVAIATGDQIIITDASDDDKIKKSSIIFSTASPQKYLSQDGTFRAPVADGDGLESSSANGVLTISHGNTSNVNNLVGSGRTYINGLTFDDYGHITAYSLNTETVVDTDLNNYVSAISGSTNGTLTLQREGLADLTLSTGHSHPISEVTNLQTELGLLAPKASPTFTGTVTLPDTGSGSNDAATKLYVDSGLSVKAPIDSPTFTGTPKAPTREQGDGGLNIATTAYVDLGLSSKAPKANPTFTGTVTLPNTGSGANEAATKGYVDSNYAPLASPTFTGIPTAPTQPYGVPSGRIANTAYVEAALAGANAYTPAFVEWNFVEKLQIVGNTASVSNATFANHTFDIANYDYKFVVDLETAGEDNDGPYIRLNNISTGTYNYLITYSTTPTLTNPDSGFAYTVAQYDSPQIETGVGLGIDSANVALTGVHLDFVVSQTYIPGYTISNDFYMLTAKGTVSALAIDGPVSGAVVWPASSNFFGSLTSSAGLTQVDIIHNLTGGTNDKAVVRVYKRAK
jgi:hypothetical protein